MVGEARISNGREEKTSFCIIDAQGVKNTDTAEEKGYDAEKNVSGVKGHVAVDTQGLPHGIAITTAGITDRREAIALVTQAKETLSDVTTMLADGSYRGEAFAAPILLPAILSCLSIRDSDIFLPKPSVI